MRELDGRVGAALGFEAGVRGAACDVQLVGRHPLARELERAAVGRRLEHECGVRTGRLGSR